MFAGVGERRLEVSSRCRGRTAVYIEVIDELLSKKKSPWLGYGVKGHAI